MFVVESLHEELGVRNFIFLGMLLRGRNWLLGHWRKRLGGVRGVWNAPEDAGGGPFALPRGFRATSLQKDKENSP